MYRNLRNCRRASAVLPRPAADPRARDQGAPQLQRMDAPRRRRLLLPTTGRAQLPEAGTSAPGISAQPSPEPTVCSRPQAGGRREAEARSHKARRAVVQESPELPPGNLFLIGCRRSAAPSPGSEHGPRLCWYPRCSNESPAGSCTGICGTAAGRLLFSPDLPPIRSTLPGIRARAAARLFLCSPFVPSLLCWYNRKKGAM